MFRSLLLYLADREGLKRFLTSHPAGRRVASRFIAGEGIEDALRVCRQLNQEGFKVTLDGLGESVRKESTAITACQMYVQLLNRLAEEKLDSYISVKLTQLGLAIDEGLAQRNLLQIAESAARHHNFVRVDMEGSSYTDATLRVFGAVDAPRDVMGIAVQSCLRRSSGDIDELLKRRVRIRLVKGAYQEPPEIAFPKKRDVDLSYVELMKRLLLSGVYHAIATHDERIVGLTIDLVRDEGISPDSFEFQMLYGIRQELQRKLVHQGWRVRLYVPFGPEWYPYSMRRLAERPANLAFVLRNLIRA